MSMLIAPQMTGPLGQYGIKNAALSDNATGYLSHTVATTGNRKTFDLFGWVKLNGAGNMMLFTSYRDSISYDMFWVSGQSGDFRFLHRVNSSNVCYPQWASALFRDCTAWLPYHLAVDTTQAVAAHAYVLTVGGHVLTQTTSTHTQNSTMHFNTANRSHRIGHNNSTSSVNCGGYIAQCGMVDGGGSAYTDFFKLDPVSGNWIGKKPTPPAWGTNGVVLDFSDAASLGADSSGNGLDFTVNGTITQVTDAPSKVYCTLSTLAPNSGELVSEGNLKFADNSSLTATTSGTHFFPVEGCYEFEITNFGSITNGRGVGIVSESGTALSWWDNIQQLFPGPTTYGSTWPTDAVVKVRVDNGSVEYFLNGVSQGIAITGLTGNFTVWGWCGASAPTNYGWRLDCGQISFVPAAGYNTMSTDNLPAVAAKNVCDHFKTVLYTGDGTASHAVTGVGFQPDFVWIKNRTDANGHVLVDAARGDSQFLQTNATYAEGTATTMHKSFDGDGFTVGSHLEVNTNTSKFVAWCAKLPNVRTSGWAGTPTITPTKEIFNADLGMSIVTYTGNGVAGATIPHSLGHTPGIWIIKRLDIEGHWYVGHKDLSSSDHYLILNVINTESNAVNVWNSTPPTSTLLTVSSYAGLNAVGGAYAAIFFAESDFIKIGTYAGNNSADGPYINNTTSPDFDLYKRIDSATHWYMLDRARDPTNNVSDKLIYPNMPDPESLIYKFRDYMATGVKLRTDNTAVNAGTMVYMTIGQPSGGRNTTPAPVR